MVNMIYSGSVAAQKRSSSTEGDELTATEVWNNTRSSVQFNRPFSGRLYSDCRSEQLFCITKDGKTAWTHQSAADADTVRSLMSANLLMTPAGQLIVFERATRATRTSPPQGRRCAYAYPVVSGNRIYISRTRTH